MTPDVDRAALREALVDRYPWLEATDRGPRAVTAGECGRCGRRPRLLPTCGPVAHAAVCRACADELGRDGWCAGHADHGRELRAWAAGLPEEWPDVVRLWWVATGEIRLGTLVIPHRLRALLHGTD